MTTALLTPAEVARELRISRATVYRMIAAGELSTVHIGVNRRTRIEAATLVDYIARNRQERVS